MKSVTEAVYNTITSDYHNEVGTLVHAEWQMNRFVRTVVDNTPSEDTDGYDIEMFPIESITKANQPSKSGIVKGIVDQMTVADDHYDNSPNVRYYTADTDDEYKYWQSPYTSATDGTMTNCAPQVLYMEDDDVSGSPVPKGISVNKIYFVVENSYSYPTLFDVQVKTTSGGSWATVASNTAIPVSGKVEYWYNGTSWTTTPNYAHNITLYGVRLVVNKMYVPTASRSVSFSTTTGNPVVTAAGGALTIADVGATITGSGIPSATVIQHVTLRKDVQRRFILTNGTTVTATSRPSNAKLEIDPIVTYYSDADISNPATATASSVSGTVSTTPVGPYFNLISLGLSLELDLTPDVATWSDQFTMGNPDFITPLGNISSNSGNVILFNDSGTYNNTNASSPLHGLLDRGVIVRGWMQYGNDLVQEFEMYSDTWNESEDSTTLSMIDASTLLMSTKPRPVLYRNMSVQEIIWRICDIIGFNNYNVEALDTDPQSTIDIFWTDGTKTAWEIFSDLSRATQTAIYFDSYGVLQIVTRGAAWNDTVEPVYSFTRDTVPGGNPSNIVTLSEDNQYEANQATVNWKPTDFSETIDNITPYEVVWEPDSTVILRSTPLAKNLLIGDTDIYFPTLEGRTWPWNAMANIEGEFIEMDAKWYIWYDKNGVRQSGWVEDYETQKKLDAASPAQLRHLNNYTGRLRIKERGKWNTVEANHYVALTNWTKSRQRNYGASNSPCTGITFNGPQSLVQIQSASGASINDYTYLSRSRVIDDGYWYLGTRMRLDKTSHRDKLGGIFFNADGGLGTGYFVEVTPTLKIKGANSKKRQEVLLYSMKADGSKKSFGGKRIIIKNKSKNHTKGKNTKVSVDIGGAATVLQGRWLDLDVRFSIGSGGSPDHHFQIWAQGSLLFEATITAASGWQHSKVGLSGAYVRGQSSASFDYFYAINSLAIDPIGNFAIESDPNGITLDNESYYDRIEDGYYGNQAYKDWAYETRLPAKKYRKNWGKVKAKYNQRFFDEFGPMAHEIREFDVTFKSDTPVLESFLYMSNRTQSVCTEYTSNSSKATFVLANMSRDDAVISGDDDTTAQGVATINQKVFVYGRPAIQQEQQQIIKTDDWAIRRRGIIDIEYSSDWIQNEEEADNFATWLTTHWSDSDSTLEVEVFGNPMVELTDLVTVNYKHIDALFYVIGVNNSFDNGLVTTLTLRKAHDQ